MRTTICLKISKILLFYRQEHSCHIPVLPHFTILCKLFLPFLFFDSTGMLFMVISVIVTINGCIAIAWSMDKLHFSRFFFGQDNILN